MKKIILFITGLLFSTYFYGQNVQEAESKIESLKLSAYLDFKSKENLSLSNNTILVNILSYLKNDKIADLNEWLNRPFHAKFIRAIYPANEKNPELLSNFILNPAPMLKADRLSLIKQIDTKTKMTSLIFLEELIKENNYHKAIDNPERFKIDNARYERLLNLLYFRLNDFKGSELKYINETMLDSKGIRIINALNETLISYLKRSQTRQTNDKKN